jgi:DNA-binding transcriptional LysR family regulator
MAIDVRRLRYIVAVAKANSITGAAEIIGLTQSALTRSIAEVEAELGVQLFERLPRGVRTTAVGQTVVERAKAVISNFDELMTGVADYRDLRSGRLCVGFTPALYQRFVSAPILEFIKEFPDVSLELIPGSAVDLVPMAVGGQLHLIVGGYNQLSRWPELRVRKIQELACVVMVRRDHPVTRRENPSERDILQYPLIQPASMGPLHADLEQLYIRNEMIPKRGHYVVDDFETVKRIVGITNAFSCFLSPDGNLSRDDDRFAYIDTVKSMPQQTISSARPASRPLSPAADAFMRLLHRTAEVKKRGASAG